MEGFPVSKDKVPTSLHPNSLGKMEIETWNSREQKYENVIYLRNPMTFAALNALSFSVITELSREDGGVIRKFIIKRGETDPGAVLSL